MANKEAGLKSLRKRSVTSSIPDDFSQHNSAKENKFFLHSKIEFITETIINSLNFQLHDCDYWTEI
jgi:hypothetical protein